MSLEFRLPRLMAISDPLERGQESFDGWLRRVADAGVDTVQIREKQLSDRSLYQLALNARRLLGERPRILINGRVDIALAAGCAGAHLPAAELSALDLRRHFGSHLLLGRSTHHPEEVAAARREGLDYVTFGPIFPTPTKAAYGPPPGLAGLRKALSHGLPVLALGGVGSENFAAVLAAGARGLAGIHAFHDPQSLAIIAQPGVAQANLRLANSDR